MQIKNSGIMFLTLSFEKRGAMGTHDEWARALKAAHDAKQADLDRNASRVSMNRDIIAEQTPLVWKELCEEFQKCCNAINEQMKPERTLALHLTGGNDFIVRPDAMEAIVVGHFARDTNHIKIQTRHGVQWFAPRAVHIGAGKVVLVSTSGNTQMSPESIARNAIAEYYS